jgi:hypothetical protein
MDDLFQPSAKTSPLSRFTINAPKVEMAVEKKASLPAKK